MSIALDTQKPNFFCLKAAFLASEPANCFISLARRVCGGFLTDEVQHFILELCIENLVHDDISCNYTYATNILKKVIVAAESACEFVVEGLYEQFAAISLLQESEKTRESYRIFKKISFLFPFGNNHESPQKIFVASLYCSKNMLEGDTGCAVWPSSLFLSEFILSYPKLFSDKVCFEVGSGVGLVGVVLKHIGASKVILTDGDRSSLENMQCNLELNNLTSESVHSIYLPWESANECELSKYKQDCVLGADVIYDPKCVPHLIRVLCSLLKRKRYNDGQPAAEQRDCRNISLNGEEICSDEIGAPIAYIAAVIRNKETFNHFLVLAEEAHLSVLDITDSWQPQNLLPYMLSYDRSAVRLYRISQFTD